MKTLVKISAAALVSLAMVGQSFAAEICARPEEAMALKAAAVQQELMVAALTCGDVGAYNQFVLSHRHELQDSDATLLSYFQRASHAGDDNYNAYKTALANNFSLASSHERRAFCGEADAAFGAAFGHEGSLASFVSDQPAAAMETYPACGEQADAVAGGSSATRMASRMKKD